MKRLSAVACVALLGFSGLAAAEIPRPEHPRPDLVRAAWQNLNGEWSFGYQGEIADGPISPKTLPKKIVVPYPVEAALSGIGDTRPPKEMWYARTFDLDQALRRPAGDCARLILHFGAVDYKASVFLNGNLVGEHTGGYASFAFDVTDAVKDSDNLLLIRVWDSLDPMQVRGKQTATGKSYSIFYTTVTGIWQTVWLEKVGPAYVANYRFTPAADLSGGRFDLDLIGAADGLAPAIAITGPNGKSEPTAAFNVSGKTITWKCDSPAVWSPDSPALYDVTISLKDCSGAVVDEVKTYVGLRTIATRDGKVFLNGRPFYQKLLLDQGYFPGGIYTPRDDEAMRADVEMYKRMGFNGLRKHQKIEDPRFLYWCDKLGLVVWEELPSPGTQTAAHPPRWARDNARAEWLEVIARDRNHPSIITWTVFNENWGIQEPSGFRLDFVNRRWADDMVRATRQADPTRLVVDNSGGYHFDTDIWDIHHYVPTVEASVWLYQNYDLKPGDYRGPLWYSRALSNKVGLIPNFNHLHRYSGQPIIVSEYGGFGWYKTEGKKGLLEMYSDYTLAMKEFPYIDGYCYTQPYDVEQEINGLMTADRTPKVSPEEIKRINDQMGH